MECKNYKLVLLRKFCSYQDISRSWTKQRVFSVSVFPYLLFTLQGIKGVVDYRSRGTCLRRQPFQTRVGKTNGPRDTPVNTVRTEQTSLQDLWVNRDHSHITSIRRG